MDLVSRVMESLKKRGLRRTFQSFVSFLEDALFDLDTARTRVKPLRSLTSTSPRRTRETAVDISYSELFDHESLFRRNAHFTYGGTDIAVFESRKCS